MSVKMADEAAHRLMSGRMDFVLVAAGGPYALDGVLFTAEQVVLLDHLGASMGIRERLARFLGKDAICVDEEVRCAYWYDYHGVTCDADQDAVESFVRRAIDGALGYNVGKLSEIHHAGNGHMSVTWKPLSDEDLAKLNDVMARSKLPLLKNRRESK